MISDLPIGGTTGLAHDATHAIDEAAAYLVAVPPSERPRPLIPALKAMFNLSAIECCQAIHQSHEIRRGGQ